MIPYQTLFEALSKHQIRYLVAGGFAVNFHQVQRATVDLDLVLHLERENILRFVSVMKKLGFSPRAPVKAEDLADPLARESWIRDKGMRVFSDVHDKNVFEVVDVFVEEPKPFDDLFGRRLTVRAFADKIEVVGKEDLISMKREAGRDRDLFDIAELEKK